ncbi:MAG: amino acid aminotransferase [Candidatus Sumerlaeia bacterium]
MFEKMEMAPPDPILGLTEAFNEDTNPNKVNLGVGVYKDGSGKTPIFRAVKKAEAIILDDEKTKSYLPISGAPEYSAAVQELLFGKDHATVAEKRAATAQTPGGTGALRVAGDFLKQKCGKQQIWVSDPTWANHNQIFAAAGLSVASYPYYNAETKAISFEAMLSILKEIPEGDILLLHGCCHNPTGVDPHADQWKQIARVARERDLILLVDLAYQGFSEGLEEDVEGLRILTDSGCDMLIASSYSKNFGLYRDRVGALTLVASNADAAKRAMSHLKLAIRSNYSNPPAHGSAIVSTIISNPELRQEWKEEVAEIRDRINEMRRLFVEKMQEKAPGNDFSFITKQNGMFSFSGLNKEQVAKLKEDFAIYIVGSGRINVAGMTPGNMDYLTDAISKVL